MVEIAWVACVLLIVYPYTIYPMVLKALSVVFGRSGAKEKDQTPSVTLIISAYNEEKVIAEKLENSLSLDYPKEKLEIIVVSDKSSDRTDEIVSSYAKRGVKLLKQKVRLGKTAGLNAVQEKAGGEILIFTDADSKLHKDTVKYIASGFSDTTIGLITGSTQYTSSEDLDVSITESSSIYTTIEKRIKKYESLLGSCVGADGAIFGLRKKLYQQLSDEDINDLVIPFNVIKQNYRVVFDERVICAEHSSKNTLNEFKRQIRITNRSLLAIFKYRELLTPYKNKFYGLKIISHKLIRYLSPWILCLWVSVSLLFMKSSLLIKVALSVGVGICCVSAVMQILKNGGRVGSLNKYGIHFLLMNVAYMIGWIKYLTGKRDISWNTDDNRM